MPCRHAMYMSNPIRSKKKKQNTVEMHDHHSLSLLQGCSGHSSCHQLDSCHITIPLLLLLLTLLALGHPSKPVEEDGSDNVKCNESHANAEISPPVVVVGVDLGQEGVGRRDGAILAVALRILVKQVPAGLRNEITEVFAARLVARRDDLHILVGAACNVHVGEARR